MPLALRRTKIKQEQEKPKVKKDKDDVSQRGRRKPPRTYIDDDPDLDIPLKSIKKEIKPKEPDEMVSMEKYYFGKIGGEKPCEKTPIAVDVSMLFFVFK